MADAIPLFKLVGSTIFKFQRPFDQVLLLRLTVRKPKNSLPVS